jgi:hypothetical protein
MLPRQVGDRRSRLQRQIELGPDTAPRAGLDRRGDEPHAPRALLDGSWGT